MAGNILYAVQGATARITLNSPENHNTLTTPMIQDLDAALRQAQADAAVRVIVLTGAGRSFCAGADLKGGGGRSFGGSDDAPAPFVTLMETLWGTDKPIVGRIQGSAYGGGVTLAAACDMAVAADEAQFTLTEVRYGVVPGYVCVLVAHKPALAHMIPMIISGETVDAEKALRLNLVHRVAPAAELDGAVEGLVQQFLTCGPNAVQEAKRLLRRLPAMGYGEGLREAAALASKVFAGAEGTEGMAAFQAKRLPAWVPQD